MRGAAPPCVIAPRQARGRPLSCAASADLFWFCVLLLCVGWVTPQASRAASSSATFGSNWGGDSLAQSSASADTSTHPAAADSAPLYANAQAPQLHAVASVSREKAAGATAAATATRDLSFSGSSAPPPLKDAPQQRGEDAKHRRRTAFADARGSPSTERPRSSAAIEQRLRRAALAFGRQSRRSGALEEERDSRADHYDSDVPTGDPLVVLERGNRREQAAKAVRRELRISRRQWNRTLMWFLVSAVQLGTSFTLIHSFNMGLQLLLVYGGLKSPLALFYAVVVGGTLTSYLADVLVTAVTSLLILIFARISEGSRVVLHSVPGSRSVRRSDRKKLQESAAKPRSPRTSSASSLHASRGRRLRIQTET
ncbi:hypothetical protein BESB_036760 [Besnoitia besnoiti]|uniref:Transmembrane protein n=1 Tax=Besnoitia besnoiti TaxID=94643 RepID=A0A2A9MFD7_BESBE|nr:hypothetical protein BESB_036760 [Besnoitia besnoiti]PFH37218.1 hypothetical protein BESB_036760 [Besnoitia besnoiti]